MKRQRKAEGEMMEADRGSGRADSLLDANGWMGGRGQNEERESERWMELG